MKTRQWKMEGGGWKTRSFVECGGKRSATPLSDGAGFAKLPLPKRRRRCALPPQSKTWRQFVVALVCFCLLPSAFCLRTSGQSYSIDWHKIAGGGGTSTGSVYAITGTIGQPDATANNAMTGGNYSLTGGFWALISVVQTPGLPNLTITHSGNGVSVSWPDPATNSYTLQQNSNLGNSGGWTTSGYTISWANGTNRITLNPPTGNLFFRLKQ